MPIATEVQQSQQYIAEVPTGRSDDGLFGPGSASWQVWSHPAMLIGITRSFILEMIGSTQGAAALEEHSFYRQDPLGRLRRTVHYFYSVVYGDSAEVVAANRRLDRLHQRIMGTDPMDGAAYSALDPYLRLGTHITTWHSVFYAYEQLGGPNAANLEADFFAESRIAGEAMGLDVDQVRDAALRHGVKPESMPDDPPSSREDLRRLWAAGRHLV